MEDWKEKGFLDVVRQLHQYIVNHELKAGDKLPSERMLSEDLQVGRSTVREALRSLELLGIIETRRGEGTFLCDASNHQLVEILGLFVLSADTSQADMIEVKRSLEEMVLQSVYMTYNEQTWPIFVSNLKQMLLSQKYESDAYLFMLREFFLMKNNRFLLKIWLLISEYHQVIFEGEHKKTMSKQQADIWTEQLLQGKMKDLVI